METHGLGDLGTRKKAAEEITRVLKLGGVYQVFFVFTIEAGRVRAEDVAMTNLVLESAPDIKHFSIIINKLLTAEYRHFLSNNFEIAKLRVSELLEQLNCKQYSPKVLFLKFKIQLCDEEEKFLHWDELNEFVQKAPCINVRSAHVNDLRSKIQPLKKTVETAVNSQLEELSPDNLRFVKLQQEIEENYNKLMYKNVLSLMSQEEAEQKSKRWEKTHFVIFLLLLLSKYRKVEWKEFCLKYNLTVNSTEVKRIRRSNHPR